LVPFWAKDTSIGYKMINARSESLSEKKSYKPLLNNKRCGIISNGFYEWKKEGNKKTPYYIKLKNDAPFSFAGLYDIWKDDKNNEIISCTIITTQANEKVAQIHDRMPVILDEDETKKWVNSENDFEKLKDLLIPRKSDEIELYQVRRVVNSPKNDAKNNLIPIKENKLF
jgi:putative SOS response-associated peptidase YedK